MIEGAANHSPEGISLAAPGMVLVERYRLLQTIAYGGMAQVWLASDDYLKQSVAIKILHPHLSNDQKFIARFKREALAVLDLSHPSIVNVYDTVSENGIEAIVMELIKGETLREALDTRGKFPVADALHIAAQTADALSAAHAEGITHRDIKPANIMICGDKRVVVTDFGIAKAESDADLTATGMLLGTAKYLAPEQVTGAAVDTRADIYSLGVLLFELLTGKPPFEASTEAATALARIQSEPPLVSSLCPVVSDDVDNVVVKAMARNVAERYQTAQQFNAALTAIKEPRRKVPRPYVPPAGTSNTMGVTQQKASKPTGRLGGDPTGTDWKMPATLFIVTLLGLIFALFLITSALS